jgi:membrane fusion protein (multidrug efflux system)
VDAIRKPEESNEPADATPIARVLPTARGPKPKAIPVGERSPSAPDAAATGDAGATSGDGGAKSAPPGNRRRLIVAAIASAALIGGLLWGWNYWTVGRFLISTDNAYIGADMSIIAPRVAGYVAKVPARANARVNAGDVLVILDDGDYRIAAGQAEARVATQDATIARLGQQIVAGEAAVAQGRAAIAAAEADAARAKADFERTQTLAGNNFASPAALDAARAARDRSIAGVDQARASLAAAEANLEVTKAQKMEAERARKELEAVLAKARRDLEATVIRAPFAGIVGNKAVEVGDYVVPSKRLMALVSAQDVYVDANFKETQLGSIRPGQRVTLVLDTDRAHALEGVVESLAPASGSLFSLLPPENATGNFTKIVQRVPVRIRVKTNGERLLIPGLSVVATVDTRPTAP